MAKQTVSIHELAPLEMGGIVARQGFSFQDYVAVHFCLEMLRDPRLDQVWCETQDDITLIWNVSGAPLVEFVQAKSNELDQLWSVAELCKKEKKHTAKGASRSPSILERSLSQDRCSEPCCFRIVTARPAHSDLEVLRYALGSPDRTVNATALGALQTTIRSRLPTAISANGNGTDFWVANAVWDCRHDSRAVEESNFRLLHSLVEQSGEFLAGDQLQELHAKLLAKVKAAAEASWDNKGVIKKLLRADLVAWFTQSVQNAAHPGIVNAGQNLRAKMDDAGLPDDAIVTAATLRRKYREEILSPKYMSSADRSLIEGEIEATLLQLRSELDASMIPDDGVSFHATCLTRIQQLRATLQANGTVGPSTTDQFGMGFMYNLVDRCPHRFRRARP